MKFRIFLFSLILSISFSYLSHAVEAWQVVGPGKYNFMGRWGNLAMTLDPAGNIYVAGHFTDANGKYFVAKWDGSSWSQLGTGSNGLNASNMIFALTSDAAGNIYAAGSFKNGSPRNNYFVSKWDGSRWQEIMNDSSYLNANNSIRAIAVDNAGNVYAGGQFTYGPSPYIGKPYVAKWDGKKWAELGGVASLQPNGPIRALSCDAKGNVYAAGAFTDTSGNLYVAKWNGGAWVQLGNLPDAKTGGSNELRALTTDNTGNLYTAGTITNSGSILYVARWNGSAWSAVESTGSNLGVPNTPGNSSMIITVAATPNGKHVYAAGIIPSEKTHVTVMHWDGSSWSELGKPPYNLVIGRTGTVWQLAINKAGEVVAAGDFTDINDICYVAKCGNYNLSVHSVQEPPIISLSPNPSSGRVNIRAEHFPGSVGNAVSVTVRNMIGQVVYSTVLRPAASSWNYEVSLEGMLPQGQYLFRIAAGESRSVGILTLK